MHETSPRLRFSLWPLIWLLGVAPIAAAPVENTPEVDPASADRARAVLSGFGAYAARVVEDWNVPGLGLAVVAGGEVVFAEGFGYRDLEGEKPMSADSLFAIGSTTKAMTATVLAMLVDEGRLEWDRPLRTYLPSFTLADPAVSDRITPRDLVTHRSGMPRHDLLWYNNHRATREELIGRMAHLELSEDLRATFQYNNLMFLTAGYLSGRLAGTSWEELVRTRLFEPLGMERSNFSVDVSARDDDYALPHRETDDGRLERIPFRRIDVIGPAGSVNSSVREMCRWLLFNLSGGKAGEKRLIQAATLADVHAPHMIMGVPSSRPEISPPSYTLGWMADTYRGRRRLEHGGGIDGFTTSVMLFPDDGLGLVAFTNRASGVPELLNRHAADLVLGFERIDWLGEALAERRKGQEAAKEAAAKKEAGRIAGTKPSHPLGEYGGEYENPGYGRLRIEPGDDGTLFLVYNDIRAPLEHWHYEVWNGAETEGDPTFQNVKLLFRSDFNGRIASVESTLELRTGPILFAKRPPAKLFDPAYLERLVGEYDLAGQPVRVALAGGALTLEMPRQPVYTLAPDLSGRFVLQELQVISIAFEQDRSGRVQKAVFHQPDGLYEAARIE